MLSDHDMVFKTLPGDVFSSTITHMKISREFMKIFFLEILAFFQILLIFTYIFLTKLCTKKWLKQRLNRSIFEWIGSSKDDKFWTDYRKYFSESYLSYSLVNTCWLNSLYTKSYGIFSFEVRHWSYSLVCQDARSRPVSPNIVTHTHTHMHRSSLQA